jgi:hypothetical protein
MPVLELEPWVQHVAYSLFHLPRAAFFHILISLMYTNSFFFPGYIQSVLQVPFTEMLVTFWKETAVFTAVTSRKWQQNDTEIVNVIALRVQRIF